jgi:hypothetical protein
VAIVDKHQIHPFDFEERNWNFVRKKKREAEVFCLRKKRRKTRNITQEISAGGGGLRRWWRSLKWCVL